MMGHNNSARMASGQQNTKSRSQRSTLNMLQR
jgi:hypothetical protein